jgi:HK97 family phage prohead protease
MSTVEHKFAAHYVAENSKPNETPEILYREFNADAAVGDGRTIDVRIVPYGERALVDDGFGEYTEEFSRGAFDEQLAAGHRLKVWLNFQHERGIGSVIGKGISLREESDGLYGSFRAFEHADGDKALLLVREEMLDSVSLEFKPKKGGTIRTAEGIVRRIKAHLDAVALCRVGAYSGAKVLAVREAPEQIIDEALLPVDIDPKRVERLRAQGIVLPSRYEAHPALDTPSRDGTSEPAPAATDNDNSEVHDS